MREDNQTADIYRLIRRRIFDKQIPMGSKINQGRLAKEFGVSRTPVVKALHKLETEGLVDNIPQKGFSVHRLNIKELADLYAVLEGLNGILFPDIFEVLNPNHIKKCEKIFAPFNNSWNAQTREEYILADKAFRNFLWNLCQNKPAKHIYLFAEVCCLY
jgi:DNA-binding GntR family transcriptional regulator